MTTRRHSNLQTRYRTVFALSVMGMLCGAGSSHATWRVRTESTACVATPERNVSDTRWWRHLGLQAEAFAASGVTPSDFTVACGLVASGTIDSELSAYETAIQDHRNARSVLAARRAALRDSENPAADRAALRTAALEAATAEAAYRDASTDLTQAVLGLFPSGMRDKIANALANRSTDLPFEMAILDIGEDELGPLLSALRAEAAASAGATGLSGPQTSLLASYRGMSAVSDAVIHIASYTAGLRTAMDSCE